MGWTSYKQTSSKKEEILNYLKDSRFEVIDIACRGRDNYVATRNIETGQIFAEVVLVETKDGEIYFKNLTEDEGPFYWNCPKRIIDKLTEATSETAKEWRAKCLNKPKPLKYGTKFKLKNPLKFTDGIERDSFEVVKYRKSGKRYVCQKTGVPVKITNVNEREYEIIS